MVKERGMIFNGEMVRAILDGRKTQTRRPISNLLGFGKITKFGISDTSGYDFCFRDKRMLWHEVQLNDFLDACPYGQPGDRLWVRETWTKWGNDIWYAADNNVPKEMSLRPSIHMPRWASRILLEIVAVRVERVQEISRGDAHAEGFNPGMDGLEHFNGKKYGNANEAFHACWDSIYGPDAWERNDWVWVIEFKRVSV